MLGHYWQVFPIYLKMKQNSHFAAALPPLLTLHLRVQRRAHTHAHTFNLPVLLSPQRDSGLLTFWFSLAHFVSLSPVCDIASSLLYPSLRLLLFILRTVISLLCFSASLSEESVSKTLIFFYPGSSLPWQPFPALTCMFFFLFFKPSLMIGEEIEFQQHIQLTKAAHSFFSASARQSWVEPVAKMHVCHHRGEGVLFKSRQKMPHKAFLNLFTYFLWLNKGVIWL